MKDYPQPRALFGRAFLTGFTTLWCAVALYALLAVSVLPSSSAPPMPTYRSMEPLTSELFLAWRPPRFVVLIR